jgi:hypothetical protein
MFSPRSCREVLWSSFLTEIAVASSTNRLDGSVHAAGADASAAVRGPDFLAQFDGFFFLFCFVALMFVILSQYVRHRRRRRKLEEMRAFWEEHRRQGQQDLWADSKTRFAAGFWGCGD